MVGLQHVACPKLGSRSGHAITDTGACDPCFGNLGSSDGLLQVLRLLQLSELEHRLQDSSDKVWEAVNVGQEQAVDRRKHLQANILKFKEVSLALANPDTASAA